MFFLTLVLAFPSGSHADADSPDDAIAEQVAPVIAPSELRLPSLTESLTALPVSARTQFGPLFEPDCDRPAASCDLECPVWEGYVDYLYWRPRQRGLDYAVSEDGTALTVGRGEIHELELDRHSGIRGQLAYRTKTGWGMSFGYTYYQTEGTDTAIRPAGIGELFATRSHPDTNEEAEIAIATGSFDYQVFDVLGYRSIFRNRFSDVRIFGGVRLADIDQALRVDYDGRDFVSGVVSSQMRMDGFGLRVGAEGTWRMSHGFGVFGRAGGGLVLGRFRSSLFESNLNGAQLITVVDDDYHQAVPELDLAGGVSWSWNGLSLAAGYEMTDWFNLSNRAAFIDDIHEGLYGPFNADILLEGLFARIAYSY
jgi:hypothetical protein